MAGTPTATPTATAAAAIPLTDFLNERTRPPQIDVRLATAKHTYHFSVSPYFVTGQWRNGDRDRVRPL
ncbi:hypothetical protein [Rhodococcus xishaensis]|uniref:Uncharacterized protein n=1 Tax=Rhodococcus xishaensis TaxID=2487364 RepID=A0A438B2I0_9NOCA|nr:hypothetical protein [Rhodococcus xishaensis]RVW05157.1 hypothetical protein EGT50_00510 [Rhodococcus xishaensis]